MEARVASLHEIRSALSAEHQHLWMLIASLRHASVDERRPPLQRLLRYLAVHEAAEEVAIHNAWVTDSTRERLDEEREAAEIVERLARLSDPAEIGGQAEALGATPSDDEFLLALDQLERSLRDHAEAEENEELPILAAELSKEQVGEMLRVVLMVREMAGDAASPIADGSFATMRLAAQREFKAAISQLR
jgi:hypothetical protein